MERFLVNMAVVKVNFTREAANIIDTYLPLVSYALSRMQPEHFSIDTFREEFNKFAEFNIPTGAMIALLKRAEKRKKYISKNTDGTYSINHDNLSVIDYEAIRDDQQLRYEKLAERFQVFCEEKLSRKIEHSDIESYFFEILYELSPQLFSSIADAKELSKENKNTQQYIVAKFVMYCIDHDEEVLETITSYVRGAMLTETFYYSHPNDLKGRIRNITVYFDTQFLTRALGYAHRSLEIPCFELVDMLKSLGVRMKCFEATFDELHRIIYACEQRALKYGRVADSRPGSVGDYFNRRNMDAGDIAVEISKLKERLQRLRIDIVPEPKHTEDYGIAEGILSEQIAEAFSFQSEEGRNHDVDCITAIHRLRKGKAQQHLESCVAIFVTTNATLAKITTNFFKEQYGRSDVSICMPDQAFTFLIWLKAVKKAPNLPRHRLVANCFAALQPTNQLWQRYIAEAKKLLDSEEIGETDYAELIHSIHAQETLMDVTMGDTDFVFGNVQEILEHAKAAEQQKYISLLGERDSTIIEQDRKLTEFEDRVSQISEKLVLWISCFMVAGLYLFGLLATKPPQLTYASLFSKNNAVFLFMVVVTLISTIGIFNIYTQLEKLARSAGNYLAAMVSRRLRL